MSPISPPWQQNHKQQSRLISSSFVGYAQLFLLLLLIYTKVHPSSTGLDPPLPPEQPEFSGAWKHFSFGIKGPNGARKTFPTPINHLHQPVLLTTRQDGPMDSCCLRQILTLPSAGQNSNQDLLCFPLLNCPVLVIPWQPLLLVSSW
jgi:hypothetical protein